MLFKKLLLLILLFVVAETLLWGAFQLRGPLTGIGLPAWIDFVRAHAIFGSWPFTILARFYLYISLTIVPSVFSILLFLLLGYVVGRLRLINGWWAVLLFASGLVLVNVPQLLYERVVLLPLRFDVLGIMTVFTLSVMYPLYAEAGYFLGRRRTTTE